MIPDKDIWRATLLMIKRYGADGGTEAAMRADFFQYTPRFKLVIIGNHKPRLRSVDEAIRRRLHLIPFGVVIPTEEVDSTLPDQLRVEWPAILQWAIDGCLKWQQHGLNPPAAVTNATTEYLVGEDAIALWLADRCEERQTSFASSAELFKSWSEWATQAGEFVGSQKRLADALQTRGFTRVEEGHSKIRGFRGLRVIPPANPDGWSYDD